MRAQSQRDPKHGLWIRTRLDAGTSNAESPLPVCTPLSGCRGAGTGEDQGDPLAENSHCLDKLPDPGGLGALLCCQGAESCSRAL